jgi:hypothetical protein
VTPYESLVNQIAGHLHAGQQIEAARVIASFSGIALKQAEENPLELINGVLHQCLNNDRYDLAAKLLWGDTIFTNEPRCTQMVWNAFKHSPTILLLGGASMSKSYSAGVWLFLDWIRDPEYTAIRVVGPSEEHLKSNLFTHLVTLHKEASIPLPGIVGDLFIGLDRKARKSSIQGVVIPLGKAGSGKLQGTKRVPRKKPHPIFGKMSRLRIFLDEIEKIPAGIWKDVDNLFANLDGVDGFKIAGACNPEDINGPVATRAEPVGGWDKGFDLETSETWRSQRGWDVVRLDPYKCENVITGKVLFPGLQTKEGLAQQIQNAGGVNSPSYYTFARGAFPPQGTTFSIVPATSLVDIQGEYIFQDRPHKAASVDVALEGSAAPKFAFGRFGVAIGIKHPADHLHPAGREEIFGSPQWALQVDQLFSLPNAETVRTANNIKQQCQSLGVDPGWVIIDRTGNGAGVHDLLKSIWSPEVRGVNYSEAATEKKIFEEDEKNCKEDYDRVVSELWFALSRWLEFKLLKISPVIDTAKLFPQLTTRLYMPGKVRRVESKRDYKSRGNESPDEADAVTLLLHVVRLASGAVPSMKKLGQASSVNEIDQPVPQVIGCTDRFATEL